MRKSKETYLMDISIIALPIIVQGLVFQVQLLINRGFLGRLGVKYLSVIGNITFPYQAPMEALIAVSIGLTIILSRKSGAGKYGDIGEYFNASLKYSMVISIVLFILWNIFSNKIFSIVGVDEQLLHYCNCYVRILSLYLIFFGIDITIQASLQGIGITKPIMYAGLLKVVMNIFLDWIFIFGNLGMPDMGVYGAATASAISNSLSTVVLIVYALYSKEIMLKIDIKGFFDAKWEKFKEISRIGIPTGLEYFFWQLGTLVLLKFLNTIDDIAVGVYTIIFTIEVLVYMIFNGIGRAALTLMGYKIGEDNEEGARKVLMVCIKYNLVIIISIFLIFACFSKNILGIFIDNSIVVKETTILFIIIAATMIPKSLNVVVGSGIRALGDTKWMLYTQIFGTAFVSISSFILIYLFELKVIAVYITIALDETIRAVLNSKRLSRSIRAL